jgi:phage host-nuclease inhibitor protein Gam
MSEAFEVKIVDGKIQIGFDEFVRLAQQLEKFGIDADVQPVAPGVANVTLKQKIQ